MMFLPTVTQVLIQGGTGEPVWAQAHTTGQGKVWCAPMGAPHPTGDQHPSRLEGWQYLGQIAEFR